MSRAPRFTPAERAAQRAYRGPGKGDAKPPVPDHGELLTAAKVMAAMILDEWPGTLTYSAQTWGPAGPEDMPALRKLEAYLDSEAGR